MNLSPDGGIGRRATLRGVVIIGSCEFESHFGHFRKSQIFEFQTSGIFCFILNRTLSNPIPVDYEILGIMNIMYVSVTERTREIGLRMSIGARGVDILSQFLIEAVITSVSGGMIGILVGLIASWLVNFIAHWLVYVQLYSVVLSFAVCTVTGVFSAGIRPKKAAGLDPIEAIRYE